MLSHSFVGSTGRVTPRPTRWRSASKYSYIARAPSLALSSSDELMLAVWSIIVTTSTAWNGEPPHRPRQPAAVSTTGQAPHQHLFSTPVSLSTGAKKKGTSSEPLTSMVSHFSMAGSQANWYPLVQRKETS